MKNKILIPLSIFGLVLLIISFVLFGYRLDSLGLGFANKEVSLYHMILWIVTCLFMLLTVVAFISKKIKISIFVESMAVFLCISALILQTVIIRPSADTYFTKVNWEGVKDLRINNQYSLLYIGRGDCGSCQEIKPMLQQASLKAKINVWYYDTSEDRDEKDFSKKIAELNVEQVPSLRIVNQKKIISVSDKEVEAAMNSQGNMDKFLNKLEKSYKLSH